MASLILRIAKLIQSRAIVDASGRPTADFVRQQNDNLTNVKNLLEAVAEQVTNIEYAVEQAGIAVLTADQIKANIALANSYTDPGDALTANVMTEDATKCRINVATNMRFYGDGTSASVSDGSITDLEPQTTYYVYYEDPARAGGAVTYYASTNYIDAAQENGTHSMGTIDTPALDYVGDVGGGGVRPPGIPYCVADNTPILMTNGFELPARELEVGMLVKTQHHLTKAIGEYEIEGLDFSIEPVFACQIRGRTIRATAKHRFWLGAWVYAEEIGTPDGNARVAKISVADAHTYVSAGVLSHNIKINQPISD